MGLGFAGVGALMLVVVFISYLRMVNKRMALRDRRGYEDRLVVEQADTLEAFGRDKDAQRLLEKALERLPNSTMIQARLDQLKLEMAEREQNKH
ncbi:tetratricopeptide repeat protein [Saccharospirillum mangrovi]|uniref:tetratricopeptide repeat protein n=1 Tax=Saccharospirillum mangrovi TaxID=2161747 RepID=UPI000D36A0CC|nr:tetratricopeptide repeat protein [Saccharospirillum mangrovi]